MPDLQCMLKAQSIIRYIRKLVKASFEQLNIHKLHEIRFSNILDTLNQTQADFIE